MKIKTINSYLFEGYLILALSSTWYSKLENVSFDVYIEKNKLHIRSQLIKN